MHRSIGTALALAGALHLLACARPSDPKTAEAPAVVADPVAVTVAPVIFRPTQRLLKFVGTLYGNEEVTLSSQAEGQIESIHVDLGDRVTEGQILAEVEDDDLRARLREIEATLDKARADEARGRELRESKVISPQEYESMQTAVAVSEAQRDTVNVLLRHTKVRSPLTGSVARRMISAGEYVRAGTALFDLVADQPLKLRGDVPERFAQELATGQPVQIAVDAYPGAVFAGRLSRISPAANAENRSVTVEALVDNPQHAAQAGVLRQRRHRHPGRRRGPDGAGDGGDQLRRRHQAVRRPRRRRPRAPRAHRHARRPGADRDRRGAAGRRGGRDLRPRQAGERHCGDGPFG